jgi:hypothetical protein
MNDAIIASSGGFGSLKAVGASWCSHKALNRLAPVRQRIISLNCRWGGRGQGPAGIGVG